MRTLVTALMPPRALQVRAENNAVHGVVWWKRRRWAVFR